MDTQPPFTGTDLFFRFGPSPSQKKEIPLVCLNGGIMADTGSEKDDYIFHNQYRYPIYAAMIGMRPMLLTYDKAQIPLYFKRLEQVKTDIKILNAFVDPYIDLDFHKPLFLPCNKNTRPCQTVSTRYFEEQLENREIINEHATGGIYLNQISPIITGLLKQFYMSLAKKNYPITADMAEYNRMAKAALFWHNKDNYIDLLKPHLNTDTLPAHVPSAVISSADLKNLTWENMTASFSSQTGIKEGIDTFFIKSNMDAAGEVATPIRKNDFQANIGAIQKEIQDKVKQMGRVDEPVKIIIQPFIERSNFSDLPYGISLTYNIYNTRYFKPLGIVGQVYQDPNYQTFIGCYISKNHTHHVLTQIGESKIQNLLQLFAQKGYRGPINLDAVLDKTGKYQFIYDCNPRLGGSFTTMTLKNALIVQGHPIDSVLAFGFRGRFVFPDLAAKLAQLSRLGLLYTRKKPTGLCLIPSFVRPNSYDFAFINAPYEQLQQILEDRILDSLSDENQKDLNGVYL